MCALFFPWSLAQQQIISARFYSDACGLSSLLALSWHHLKFHTEAREGRPPAPRCCLLWRRPGGRCCGGRLGFPSQPAFWAASYPLASREPHCLFVCIYFQFLQNPSSKIPLSWTGPTLGAWNVLMLRLALHIWHILSIRDNSSRAHRKQTNDIHGTVFSLLSGERGAENSLKRLEIKSMWEWTLFKSTLKDEFSRALRTSSWLCH